MPPPGPCDASAALLHNTAAIEVAAGVARDIAVRVRNDVMEISIQKALSKIRRQSAPGFLFHRELPPAFGRQAVELGLPSVLRLSPVGGQPSALL